MISLYKIVFWASVPHSFLAFILPVYLGGLGISPLEVGYLFSVFTVTGFLARPLVGRIIDKKGKRFGILLGLFCYCLVYLFFIGAFSFRSFLLIRIIQALASTFLWLSVDLYLREISSSDSRAKNFGILDERIVRGQMLGSALALSILINDLSPVPFKLIFSIYLLANSYAFIYALRKLFEPSDNKINSFAMSSSGAVKRLEPRLLLALGLLSFILSISSPILLIFVQDRITARLDLISFLFLPSALLAMYLPSRFGILADSRSRLKIVISGLFLSGLTWILLGSSSGFLSFLVIYTFLELAGLFYRPAYSSLLMDYLGEEKRGQAYARYSLATGLGAALGPLVGSYIYSNYSSSLPFYIQGVLIITFSLASTGFYLLKEGKKDEQIL